MMHADPIEEWECEHCEANNRSVARVIWCWRCGLWRGYDYRTYPAKPKEPTPNTGPIDG